MGPDDVKAWRAGLGLLQVEAARALGICRRTLINWETGERAPDLRSRLAMAALARGITDYHGPESERPAEAGPS